MAKIYLTKKQWGIRIKTIETKTLKTLHHCTSLIREKMDECITMLCDDLIEIDETKYKEFRKICMSEDFNNAPEKYFNNRKFIK